MEYKDYYKIMGVARGASHDEVKRAYRRLARKYHPDVSKERNAEERFKQVNEAYEVLSNPKKRSAYDAVGRQRTSGRPFASAWEPGVGFGRGRARGTLDFGELFETLFGAAGFRAAREQAFERRTRDPHSERGADIETTVTLSLEEAFEGVTKRVTPARPAPAGPMSRLHIWPKTVNVRVPPGAVEGQRIRVRLPGRARTDLVAVLRLAPHPYFRAQGRDIHLELPLLPWEAALGGMVQTPTLGGPVDLRIPRGSQSGHKLRLRGRGLPGTPPGDQLVRLQVVAPPAVTAEAEALYRRMAATLTVDPRAHFGSRR